MEKLSLEVKVGIVVVAAVGLVIAFLVLLGGYNPFSSTYRIIMTLTYAGGIKPGSDVHLAGAKVGKVDSIRFTSGPSEGEPTMELILLIDKRAKDLIREDSTFAVHMESLLGGKIVEISPGSTEAKVLEDGAVVRGIDPPRMEQLISQGVDLLELITSFTDQLTDADRERLRQLIATVSTFSPEDVKNIQRIISNMSQASDDLKVITGEVRPQIGPILDDAQGALADARPLIREAKGTMRDARQLVTRIDRTVAELEPLLPEDGDTTRAKLRELMDAADDLAATADRLERFTAMVETEFGDVDRQELERWIREFLQQEGVTINVGTIVGDPHYPPPPPAPEDQQATEPRSGSATGSTP